MDNQQQLTTLNPQALEQIKESSQLRLLESFFDHNATDSKRLRSLWNTLDQIKNRDFLDNILVEGLMEKQGRKLHSWHTRHYILYEGFLAYKEVKKVGLTFNDIYIETQLTKNKKGDGFGESQTGIYRI
jgi:hypothetical protein